MREKKEKILSYSELLELKRWNTPTIYNGWEQITLRDSSKKGFNIEPLTDFMPHMGVMVGYAVTVVVEPGNDEHSKRNPQAWTQYRQYIAETPGPKIVVVQDLDKPNTFGAFWGEVNSNIHIALGCIGSITDGGIRDIDEMNNAGFKTLARTLCVGHAYSCPIDWGGEVTVFGTTVKNGQLIHADKHGFLVIPEEDQHHLLEASRFMDSNECRTVIPAARNTWNKSPKEKLTSIEEAAAEFQRNVKEKYNEKGEWV